MRAVTTRQAVTVRQRLPRRLLVAFLITSLLITAAVPVWAVGMFVGAHVASEDCLLSHRPHEARDWINVEVERNLFGWTCHYYTGSEPRTEGDTTWFWEYAFELVG
jgi:hypothetical protein